MRINESRNRRMFIMQQISFRQHSREPARKSSAQRRKKIQSNLNEFMKTMSDVGFRNIGGSEAFKYNNLSQQQNFSPQNSKEPAQTIKEEYDNILRSPSFKDINLGNQHQKSQENPSSPQNLSVQSTQKIPLKPESEKPLEDEQIKLNISAKKSEKEQNQVNNKSIAQNESSASAIFFTSQFNQFISQNHLKNQEIHSPMKKSQQNFPNISLVSQTNRQVTFAQQNYPLEEQLKQERQNQKIFSPKCQDPQEIGNDQKEYDQIAQKNHESNHFPATIQDQAKETHTLMKNKSGHSLALSNQSSLKYSLYQSNIKQLFNKKIANELIVETHQFQSQNQQSSLLYQVKWQILSDKIIVNQLKKLHHYFTLFSKIYKFNKKVEKRKLHSLFEAFLINQELNFKERKQQIMCDKFMKQKTESKLKQIFQGLKNFLFILPRQKLQQSEQFRQRSERKIKETIFRNLKIVWFDQKVKKQVQMYYLSKIFSHFTRVLKTQKQVGRNKSLNFYCFNLKKKFFKMLSEGVYNLQNQRNQREAADWHYSIQIQRKVFDAWKDRLSYKDRYISLAMTTKNTFKQTSDQKWLQIKTVDFRQIK